MCSISKYIFLNTKSGWVETCPISKYKKYIFLKYKKQLSWNLSHFKIQKKPNFFKYKKRLTTCPISKYKKQIFLKKYKIWFVDNLSHFKIQKNIFSKIQNAVELTTCPIKKQTNKQTKIHFLNTKSGW